MPRLSRANLPHLAAPAAPLRFGGDGGAGADRHRSGASTGGTEATLNVLRRLPANIPGMVIVQHMPVGFTKMYAERLNRLCQMEVREAVNGDEIRPGLALVAPADYQAKVVRMGPRYTLSCIPGEKVKRAPALGGCPLFLNGRLGPLPHGWYHHDGDGPGWGQRSAGDAEGRGVHDRPG